VAKQSAAALDGIAQFLAKLNKARVKKLPNHLELSDYEKRFQAALADDFNTAEALAVIFNFIGDVNKKIWNLSSDDVKKAGYWVNACLQLFGITLELPKVPSKIATLAKARESFRVAKEFAESDNLRKEIENAGYVLEDTPAGPFLWPKNTL
jgi:cysteinyl-tRNA synthetase